MLKKLCMFLVFTSKLAQTNCLDEATGLKNMTMSYEKYNTVIVHQHHVRIAGWPDAIIFNLPKITSSADLHFICQGLEVGSIRWVWLSHKEIKELDATYLEEHQPVKKRRNCSGADKPAKKQRGSKKGKQSAQLINDSDDIANTEN